MDAGGGAGVDLGVDAGLFGPNDGSGTSLGVDPGIGYDETAARVALGQELTDGSPDVAGQFLADGTLLKPVVVDATVEDGRDQLRSYKVRSGDTLTGIASRTGVSMMTIWWANKLKSKDDLKVGQVLTIPPVDGVVRTVKAGDTLASVAAAAKVDAADIVAANALTDETLVIGQVLIIPGARGAPIPTPKPTRRPEVRVATVSRPSSRSSARQPAEYSGGSFAWPVAGGYISQYSHYGHPALDVAADYGTGVLAAGSGTVVFAGWKSNGGGYQVWIAHGGGLYTTYNHLSSIATSYGDQVGRASFIGRIGTSGWATGPHLHFEIRYLDVPLDPMRMVDYDNGKLISNTFPITKKVFYPNDYDVNAVYHKIRSGDTLGALSKKYHTSVKEICAMNKIKSTTTLRIGRVIRVR